MSAKRYAVIVSSGRAVPIEKEGDTFWVVRPKSPYHAGESLAGPYQCNDPRFYIMPSHWIPLSER
jgi:hypothetical protein